MGIHPLAQMKEAVTLGKNFIKGELAMAAACNKHGDKAQERKYFQSACELNNKVISLELQIGIIESSIN